MHKLVVNTSDPNDTNALAGKTATSPAEALPAPRGRDATLDEFNRAAERVAVAYHQALSELKDE
jgi:hypothetical protein